MKQHTEFRHTFCQWIHVFLFIFRGPLFAPLIAEAIMVRVIVPESWERAREWPHSRAADPTGSPLRAHVLYAHSHTFLNPGTHVPHEHAHTQGHDSKIRSASHIESSLRFEERFLSRVRVCRERSLAFIQLLALTFSLPVCRDIFASECKRGNVKGILISCFCTVAWSFKCGVMQLKLTWENICKGKALEKKQTNMGGDWKPPLCHI